MNTPLLKATNLTKSYGPVVANDNISFELEKGEIHCLFGENGAGKSTLAKMLYGASLPDTGSIHINGEIADIRSPLDAIHLGISMVHQHFILIPVLTVLENIIVGNESTPFILNYDVATKNIENLMEHYGIHLDLSSYVWQLSVGEQQWVEILKGLHLGARLLILDEPTAVLTPPESEKLFQIINKMTEDGISIILISHKLNEVMQSNRVTVLRRGKNIGTVWTKDVTSKDLTTMMVGREVDLKIDKPEMARGAPIATINSLSALNDREQVGIQGISLTIHQNEIVGIAGVAGNGQNELFEVIVGARPATSGAVVLNGKDITNHSPRDIQKSGVGHVPNDRFGEGLVPSFSIAENIILGQEDDAKYNKGAFFDEPAIRTFAEQSLNEFEIKAESIDQSVGMLSGGNAQKVILAREIDQCANLLLANQPTRGLDVGVIKYVYEQLLAMRSQGYGILLASEELDDIFALSDRIAVMSNGEIVGLFDAKDATKEKVGLMMGGEKQ